MEVKYERLSTVRHRVTASAFGHGNWFCWETDRFMVPVARLRNPLAGHRTWKLRLGRLTVEWH